jgi:peroxiredoxin Q/BCP
MMIFALLGLSKAADVLEPGMKAPDFMLPDAEGKVHKLSDYLGKTVVLYFYPKDDTPGCTKEACNLRDNFDSLKARNIVILGVSYDDRNSHEEFIQKYKLPFTLLSDTAKIVAEKYGAKGTFGMKRITYLIGKEGKILHRFDDVDTANHSAQIMAFLKEKKQ